MAVGVIVGTAGVVSASAVIVEALGVGVDVDEAAAESG